MSVATPAIPGGLPLAGEVSSAAQGGTKIQTTGQGQGDQAGEGQENSCEVGTHSQDSDFSVILLHFYTVLIFVFIPRTEYTTHCIMSHFLLRIINL